MASAPTLKSLGLHVDRLNQQVCTLMAYISHLEQTQQTGIEERFVEAAAKQILPERLAKSADAPDHIHITATYLARGEHQPRR